MRWHFIAGEDGCRYAVEHGYTAVVVDALRASATAAYMLHEGASEILAVREVAEAYALKRAMPDALLAGERGGLPPDGFDLGNSPRGVSMVHGKRVIFTTTTGAGRLLQAWGAKGIYMGSTVNATAVARVVAARRRDVVLIPAGLMADPAYAAQEDWVGTAAIAIAAERELGPLGFGEGGHTYTFWRDRIVCDDIPALFDAAPHARNLCDVGLGADIGFCAMVDTVATVPTAMDFDGVAVRLCNEPA